MIQVQAKAAVHRSMRDGIVRALLDEQMALEEEADEVDVTMPEAQVTAETPAGGFPVPDLDPGV